MDRNWECDECGAVVEIEGNALCITCDYEARQTLEVYQYLDDLRESGVTNMYGARPYIQDQFEVSKADASRLLKGWMQTFGERHEVN